jgi:hypothetical protein
VSSCSSGWLSSPSASPPGSRIQRSSRRSKSSRRHCESGYASRRGPRRSPSFRRRSSRRRGLRTAPPLTQPVLQHRFHRAAGGEPAMATYLNRGRCQVAAASDCGAGWFRSFRGARAYLGARPWGRRRDARWVDPRGTTPAARALVDRRRWAGVAAVAGAGRKTASHLEWWAWRNPALRGCRGRRCPERRRSSVSIVSNRRRSATRPSRSLEARADAAQPKD